MSDLLLSKQDDGNWDLAMFGGDFVLDGSMRTACLISLLTDQEAPDVSLGERRGWWGDALAEVQGDKIGSLLWTLQKPGKIMPDILTRAKTYAEQSLEWMLEDGFAKSVQATPSLGAVGELNIDIDITKPDGTAVETIRFADIWSQNFKADALKQLTDEYAWVPDVSALLNDVVFNQYPSGLG